jgi:LacI family transcriptional regulator
MKGHQVTIKDIARELGISPSTVSRAIKDHPDISPATKRQVQELVEKLKYKPNAVALSLRSRKSNSIAVLVPEIVHHFFSTVISGIEEVALEAGYNVMIFQSNELYEREVQIAGSLSTHLVDGVLVSLSKNSTKFGHLKEIMEEGLPLVFFDRACDMLDADRVVVDDFNGAFQAVEYLIKSGCSRIAHYSTSQHLQIGYQRKRGYISALESHGMMPDEQLIVKCDTMVEALEVTSRLMKLEDPPDAIFAVNDLTAAGAIQSLKQMRFRIPEDVSIVGFTDGLVARVTDPPLSSVSQHGFELGKKAMTMLLRRINILEEDIPAMTEVLPTELVLRGTTRPLH